MNKRDFHYCDSLTKFTRFKTKEVLVGNIGIGGGNPIRIQSMTTTNTLDTEASVQQAIKMIDAGCELVRLTAPSLKDAKNLYEIKNKLIKHGYQTPLIADIHFTPNAAIEAAKIVEKVRINPGNFLDKKRFKTYNFSKKDYTEELKRIEEKFLPLINVCKAHKTAMRIGTNHGSLSDRILSHYGDTPRGMVESALEFVRICEKFQYHEIILSMKASNPIVMIQAYRLLIKSMKKENMNYPIHLGVTEAGEGDDGRIKSAMGIGSLLLDGIGDTIRVSLTEPPENEIPVARSILNYIKKKHKHDYILEVAHNPINPFIYSRRVTNSVINIGGGQAPVVLADFSFKKEIHIEDLSSIGYTYSIQLDKWHISETACDYIFVGDCDLEFELPSTLGVFYNYKNWSSHKKGYPFFRAKEYLRASNLSKKLNIIHLYISDLTKDLINKIIGDPAAVLLIDTDNTNGLCEQRRLFIELINNQISTPVIICRSYQNLSKKQLQIQVSIDFGPLLLDGLGDGVAIFEENSCNAEDINSMGFNLLQATRTRISKTEYISCPSCGRTQFNLEETTAKIREKTSHLKGLKIGIMGCIVNGPGEMADADYGYVGAGNNKVSLYKKKEMVKKNINTEDALEELIRLIKDNGDWVDS